MRIILALLVLVLVLVLVCSCSNPDEAAGLVTITPSAFSDHGVWTGAPWDVAMAPLPAGACTVDVHLSGPHGNGITIGILEYTSAAPRGVYLDEIEGLYVDGWYRLTAPPTDGPLDLLAINQSGGRDHLIFAARVAICR